ncbi:hypothetical protein B1A85_13920 [Chroococcidiopsis sp. TS-821]|nr:hypothetical protein B1A85_13920 [Chroococcidiopsis sp. TS-821]
MGVIYVAIGSKYVTEALNSASSLKDKVPGLDVTIFSDESVKAQCIDKCIVIESSKNGYLDKIVGMSKSPYEFTLYLDCDTYICDDFSELFTLLKKYDIGAAEAEIRAGSNLLGEVYNYQEIKDIDGQFVFPIYNSGVILYKKSPQVDQFFADWLTLAERQMQEKGVAYGDQPAFQTTLHKSNLREVILTPEYNCRFIFPVCVSGRVKILHGRHLDIKTVAKEINSRISTRIFHPRWGLIPDEKVQLITKVLSK